jgi:hypothetical protein
MRLSPSINPHFLSPLSLPLLGKETEDKEKEGRDRRPISPFFLFILRFFPYVSVSFPSYLLLGLSKMSLPRWLFPSVSFSLSLFLPSFTWLGRFSCASPSVSALYISPLYLQLILSLCLCPCFSYLLSLPSFSFPACLLCFYPGISLVFSSASSLCVHCLSPSISPSLLIYLLIYLSPLNQ